MVECGHHSRRMHSMRDGMGDYGGGRVMSVGSDSCINITSGASGGETKGASMDDDEIRNE